MLIRQAYHAWPELAYRKVFKDGELLCSWGECMVEVVSWFTLQERNNLVNSLNSSLIMEAVN